MVAVESLKHSAGLSATLAALVDALAPGGRMVVVEDVLVGDGGCPSARRVVSDWSLTELHREADYVSGLGGSACRVVDLTPAVRLGHPAVLSAKLVALGLALTVARRERAAALRAFRGGVHLEKLYAAGAMRYEAFLHQKSASEAA